ncbi:hypothetical protein [Neobacillus sp. SAB-20_R2A]|uniref:hypothetical protein n=1 Tax=Neobacillus sp. SAB-20_R2A TaxID=3120519 RepID=UPI003C6DBD22
MKKIFLILFALGFIFSFDLKALADEGHSHDQSVKNAAEKFKNGSTDASQTSSDDHATMEGMDHDSGSGDHATMEGMDHGSGSDDHANMDGMDHESGSNGQATHEENGGHSHGAVVETPPNYKVLGTYGAVNLSFVMIGIWNKWFRRKEK